jgi:hypothetical protein
VLAIWDDIVRTGGWDVGGTPPLALGAEAAGLVRGPMNPVIPCLGSGRGHSTVGSGEQICDFSHNSPHHARPSTSGWTLVDSTSSESGVVCLTYDRLRTTAAWNDISFRKPIIAG